MRNVSVFAGIGLLASVSVLIFVLAKGPEAGHWRGRVNLSGPILGIINNGSTRGTYLIKASLSDRF